MLANINHIGLKSISILLLGSTYFYIGYSLERSQFWLLFALVSVAFLLSFYLYRTPLRLRYMILLSFLLKLIFIGAIPEFSQDFYRFIWDGMLVNSDLNPYINLPSQLLGNQILREDAFSTLLYDNMGSLSNTNYSTYPPVAQFFYAFNYAIAGDSLLYNVVILRLLNLLAEAGVIYFGLKILKVLKLPKKTILLFILNPLVILESSFNLHFEVVMLLFLAMSIYYLYASKIYTSALAFAAAVASKMIPLLLLPLLLSYTGKDSKLVSRPQLVFILKIAATLLVSLVLAYSMFWDIEVLSKSFQTLSLYFTSFEFNASIYYVLRWVGYQWTGYNTIAVLGQLLSVIICVAVLFLSLKHKMTSLKTLLHSMLFASTIYYLLSTTIHPWYLMLPLFLSIFTHFRFMLVWSWLVFLSYSAYRFEVVQENFWLLGIQYSSVLGVLAYEVLYKKSHTHHSTAV